MPIIFRLSSFSRRGGLFCKRSVFIKGRSAAIAMALEMLMGKWVVVVCSIRRAEYCYCGAGRNKADVGSVLGTAKQRDGVNIRVEDYLFIRDVI